MAINFKITKDVDLIKKLDGIYFDDDERGNFAFWTNWVISVEGKTAGYCSAVLVDKGDAVFLARAGVLNDFRGQGVQRASVNHRIRWGRRHGAKIALTYVHPDNYRSWVNLVKTGFKIYTPDFAFAGREFFYFQKEI